MVDAYSGSAGGKPKGLSQGTSGTSAFSQLLWALTGCGVGLLFLDSACRMVSLMLEAWDCHSAPQRPTLLPRRVRLPRLLGGARNYAKLTIKGAKGSAQDLMISTAKRPII